jgi:hypothetical protein
MPGLLDFLNTDDGKLGIALLAAAGPSMQPMGFGQRLQGAMQSLDADKQNALKTGLLQAQTDNFKSEVAARQAGLLKDQQLMDWIKSRQQSAAPSVTPTAPGQLGSGSFGAVAPPAGLPSIQPPSAGTTPAGGGFINSLSADDAFMLKALGKDPIDVINAFKPDWKINNGFAFNANDRNFKAASCRASTSPMMVVGL